MSEILSHPLADRIANLPDFTQNVTDVAIPQAAIDAAIAALDAGKTKYADRPGIIGLREWVAAHLEKRFNVPYKPDEITITCGGTEARFVAVKLFCEPETHLICPGDSSPIAGAAALIGVDVQSEVVDPEKVSAVYLTPDDDPAWFETAKEQGWWVIYEAYYGSPTHHPAQDADLRPKVLSIGSLEPRLPGWRIGWMAGCEIHGKLRSYKQSMTICTPSISQWAALGMVEAE